MADVFNFYVRDNRKINFEIVEPIMREDSGVTDFRFHIPKTLNGLEVSDWSWWFVFVNAKKEKYSVALTLSDDPESPLEFNIATYTVDYAMSIKAGAVQFALEAINTGTGGAIDNEWHTLTYETKVKETLQGNQAEYAETEADIISALLQEVRTKMDQIVGGATPTPVASVSAMTDTSKLYLLTTDGEWYYYNGSAWVSGGVYGAGVTDAIPTHGSTNAVQSGGVYEVVSGLDDRLSSAEEEVGEKQNRVISSTPVTDVEIISENDEANLATKSKHIDCTVTESDGVITLTVPISKGVQWILFGGGTTSVADSTLTGNVQTILEFDYTTNSVKTDATIVDKNNDTEAVRLTTGTSHAKIVLDADTVKYVYLMVQDYASNEVTVSISNVQLYYQAYSAIEETVEEALADLRANQLTFATKTELQAVETSISGKQDENIELVIETGREVLSSGEEGTLASKSVHVDCTVTESGGVITLTVPSGKGVQWILFGGGTGLNPPASALTGDVELVFEFDCTTNSVKTDATLVDTNNTTKAVRIPSGSSHVKVVMSATTVKYVYLMVQDYASNEVTVNISNVNLYYHTEETEQTTVIDAIKENTQSVLGKISDMQTDIPNVCIQPLSIDADAEIYKTIKTYNNATVAYENGQIVLQPVAEWTTTQQWVIFGDAAIPVANYIPMENVPSTLTLEFDYSTEASNARIYVTDRENHNTSKKLASGNNLHFKAQYDYTTVGNVFFNIENSSDAGKTIYVWNVRLYYGGRFDGTAITEFVRYIGEKAGYTSANVSYKKLLTIGDSLSNICPWQPYVMDILNIPFMTKSGGVGYTVANVSASSIYNAVMSLTADSLVDLVIFWGGTNDYGQGVVIGDFDTQLDQSTRDSTTFYGGYMDCVEHLLGLYPDKRIVLVGTIIRSSGGQSGKEVNARNHTNSAGNKLDDYVDAVRKIAEWYGLPFVDLLRTAGISMQNIDSYLYIQGDTSNRYYLHLSNWGSEQIGKRIGSFIKSIG